MPLFAKRPPLHVFVAIPVFVIVLAAFALSVSAVKENIRFITATNQILNLAGTVRAVAAGQKGFAQNPGEDIWADLEHMGQIASTTSHLNPWQGDVRMMSVSDNAMRIESDMPTHDCRRLALYFMGRQPGDLGLLSLEVESFAAHEWMVLYPTPPIHNHLVEAACGAAPYARLAVVFKIRQ